MRLCGKWFAEQVPWDESGCGEDAACPQRWVGAGLGCSLVPPGMLSSHGDGSAAGELSDPLIASATLQFSVVLSIV